MPRTPKPASPRPRRRGPDPGRWKFLLLMALVAALTVGHLLGYGKSFPTLIDWLNGAR